MKFLDDRMKWTKEIVFAVAWKLVSHEHVTFCMAMPNVLECCQFIYILYDHVKWIILMQNQHIFIEGSHDSNFTTFIESP